MENHATWNRGQSRFVAVPRATMARAYGNARTMRFSVVLSLVDESVDRYFAWSI